MEDPVDFKRFAIVIEEEASQEIEFSFVTEGVGSEVAWIVGFASMTEDANNQTIFSSVTEDATSRIYFSSVTEDVASQID
jgi:hypothetical protein